MNSKTTTTSSELDLLAASVTKVGGERPHCIESYKQDAAVAALFGRACGDSYTAVASATGLSRNTIRELEARHSQVFKMLKQRATLKCALAADQALELASLKIRQVINDPEALAKTSVKETSLAAAILLDKSRMLSSEVDERPPPKPQITFESYQRAVREAKERKKAEAAAKEKAKVVDVEDVSNDG